MDEVWVFSGSGGRFPGGLFTSVERAEGWILRHSLTGVLTKYPLDVGAFDWAVEAGLFRPKQPKHLGPDFIGSFSSASFEHVHYENGVRE